MLRLHPSFHPHTHTVRNKHRIVPHGDYLEDRVLLYSAYGDQWTFDSRITYSFMPDGTNVGGVPSALFQTLNANYPTATWEQQLEQAASLWEGATNANLALVSDGGEPVGSAGDQQDDPRFGDIRIGAIPLGSGILAETFLPPPDNGGTDAGDILLNSSINWQINSNYDLLTVAAHEFGHALGLGDSTVSTAVMYGTYTGIKQSLASDDIAGIQSIYGTRQYDQFNSNGYRNNSYQIATNITPFISNAQIAIPSLDNTTTGDSEWYYVTVPSSTTGGMTVTVQSSNLSSFAPRLMVFNSSLGLVGQASAPNTFGATISVSTSVAAGQSYYFKVLAASPAGAVGGYGLLANFGSQSQSPIQPPNTVVPSAPNQGGNVAPNDMAINPISTLSGWIVVLAVPSTSGQNGPGSGFGPQMREVSSAATSGSARPATDADAETPVFTSMPLTGGSTGMPISSAVFAIGLAPVAQQASDDVLGSWPFNDRPGR